MKTTLLLIFTFLCSLSHAQQTYNIDWEMGVNGAAASLTVETGDTVIWTWTQNETHDVSSIDPNAPEDFGSDILTGAGNTYEYTFTEEAVFDYRCSVHPNDMFGTITVEEALSMEDKFIKNLQYFPNPALETLTITSLIPIETINISDINGRQISYNTLLDKNNVVQLDMSSLKNGLYFIQATSINQQTTTFKVTKK